MALVERLATGEHPEFGSFTLNRAVAGASLFVYTELPHPDDARTTARYVIRIGLQELVGKVVRGNGRCGSMSDGRNRLLALVHAGAKALGMDEATRRALQVRLTGKASCADMTASELHAVVRELRRKGFKPKLKNAKAKSGRGHPRDTLPEGELGAKLKALWLSGWHLGVVRNPSESSLARFIERQNPKLSSARFAHKGPEAARAVEGLKAWLAREAGVDWSSSPGGGDNPRARVLEAQWRILGKAGAVGDAESGAPSFTSLNSEHAISLMETMGKRIRAQPHEREDFLPRDESVPRAVSGSYPPGTARLPHLPRGLRAARAAPVAGTRPRSRAR